MACDDIVETSYGQGILIIGSYYLAFLSVVWESAVTKEKAIF